MNSFSYKRKTEEGGIALEIDCMGFPYSPALEDSEEYMRSTLEILSDLMGITKVSFAGMNVIEYGLNETRMLKEFANAVKGIKKSELTEKDHVLGENHKESELEYFNFLQETIDYLYQDPLGGYVKLKRDIVDHKKKKSKKPKEFNEQYVSALQDAVSQLEKTKLVQKALPHLVGHKIGDRDIYRKIFTHTTRPNFSLTRFYFDFPEGGELLSEYELEDGTLVRVFKRSNSTRNYYHVTPPELNLSQKEYYAIDFVRNVLATHKPKAEMLLEPEGLRHVFQELSRDLLQEYVESNEDVEFTSRETDRLASIITRANAGFGVLENLLADNEIQDININAPLTSGSLKIYHSEYEECDTNILPNAEEVTSWSSRLKLISGRPLDQANQVLDANINVPGVTARAAAVTKPLSPNGLAFSIRRHRERPWTYPLYLKNKMINPMGAALLSLAIDTGRTILFAGTRGSGKTSVLGASCFEIMKKYRIISVEDTLELPIPALFNMGYDALSLKVKSAMIDTGSEMSAEQGIRTSLRLGDSCLLVGEVRSTEARALFEAMRVGALSNVVAGTIHGESPYGVFDRVVNDLGVPPTSFKAIDLIVITSLLRSADGLKRKRRITKITEVKKHWKEDPFSEGGFLDLMVYNADKDELVPTDALIKGESEMLSKIAEGVPEWKDFSYVWENLKLRAEAKDLIVKYAKAYNLPSMLEASFVSDANSYLHLSFEEVLRETGKIDNEKILEKWKSWVKQKSKVLK